MTTEVADLVGRRLANDRYEVLKKLGEGGMGFVYKARDHNLDCDVVIKIPRPAMLADAEFKNRFTRELRSLVKLAAPHIVKIIDIGEQHGIPFAVMDFLAGGSLEDRQRRGRDGRATPLAPEELLDWLEPVAQALDFIHAQGYIHRDIKPANILFDAHGNAYVGDFGVAKVMHGDEDLKRTNVQTQDGMVLGTAHYMAPEMIMGQKFDGRVDQYALAATVYEMVAGRVPITGPNPHAIMVKQTTHKPTPLHELIPGTPSALSLAVDQGLAKNPRQRYSNCEAFARAAVKGLKPGATGAARGMATSPAPSPLKRSGPQQSTGRVEQARIDTKGTIVGRTQREMGPQGTLLESAGRRKKSGVGGLMVVGVVLALLSAATVGGMWFFNRAPNSKTESPSQSAKAFPAPGTKLTPPPPPSSISLTAIDAVSLDAGGKGESIAIKIERRNCDGEPVELEITSLPADVTAEKRTLSGNQVEVTLELKAAPSAVRVTNHKARVVARSSRLNLLFDKELLVTVSVAPTKPPTPVASLKLSSVLPVSLVAGGPTRPVRVTVQRVSCAGEPVEVEIIGLPDKVTTTTKQTLPGNADEVTFNLKADAMAPTVTQKKVRVEARIAKLNLRVTTDLLVTVQPPAPPPAVASLRLKDVKNVTLAAGGASKPLLIEVTRQNCAGEPVQLDFTGLPKTLGPPVASVSGNATSQSIDLKAPLSETTTTYKVKVVARITKGNLKDEKDFEVKVRPLALKLGVDSPSLEVEESKTKSLTVTVTDRDGYTGPIQLQIGASSGKLTRVKVNASVVIPSGQMEAKVSLEAVSNGPPEILAIRTSINEQPIGVPTQVTVTVTNLGKSYQRAESSIKRGVDHNKKGKNKEAIQEFKQAVAEYGVVIKANPKDVRALFGLGSAYLGLKDVANAESSLTKAKGLDKDNVAVAAYLAYLNSFKGETQKTQALNTLTGLRTAANGRGPDEKAVVYYLSYVFYDDMGQPKPEFLQTARQSDKDVESRVVVLK